MSSERNLRILNPNNFVNPSNMMRIEAVRDDVVDKQYKLSSHPEYASMSYYSTAGKRYKDLPSFLKKFRCKNCHIYGHMAAINNDKKAPHMIQALICTNCKHVAPLEMPIDRNNIGKTSTGLDKRPNITGRSTKFKMPISESEKTGLSKALRKSSGPRNFSSKTRLLETTGESTKPSDSLMKIIHKQLRNAGLPVPQNSIIKSVYDAQDIDYNEYMQGKGIIKESVDYNRPQDIARRNSGLSMLY